MSKWGQAPFFDMLSPCLIVALMTSAAAAQAPPFPDLVGHWELEKVTFGTGGKWRSGMPVEAIDIQQSSTELVIEGSRGLFEGTPPAEKYLLDGSTLTYVQEFGEWWRKSQTWIEKRDATLTFRLRTRAGWYRSAQPAQENLARPHGDVVRRVTFDGGRLTIRTEVFSDDDPPGRDNQTSTQIFVRAR